MAVRFENGRDAELALLEPVVEKLMKKWPNFNPAQFINYTSKSKGAMYPPRVYLLVFKDMVYAKAIRDPWAFGVSRFTVHSQNVREEEMQKLAEVRKKEVNEGMMSLAEIMKRATGGK